MDFITELQGRKIEFIEDTHEYFVDGVLTPSVTQVLSRKFGGKYKTVDKAVLEAAREKGIAVHEGIENLCRTGEVADMKEVRNFRFLQKHYGFEVVANEVPVLLCIEDKPITVGRLDLVITMDGETGLADIKRTATLDKEYLAYQLNIYRLAYMQTYGDEIKFLRGVHLRENTRKFVTIPVNENLVREILEGTKNEM